MAAGFWDFMRAFVPALLVLLWVGAFVYIARLYFKFNGR